MFLSEIVELLCDMGKVAAVIVLTMGVAMLPVSHVVIHAEIVAFEEVRDTAERMREDERLIESAAFQNTIATQNQKIRVYQYFNGTVLGWWVPDEVESLKPIR